MSGRTLRFLGFEVLIFATAAALVACGQRGPLYLPDEAPIEVRQTTTAPPSSAPATGPPAKDAAAASDEATTEDSAGKPAPQAETPSPPAPGAPAGKEDEADERNKGTTPEKPR